MKGQFDIRGILVGSIIIVVVIFALLSIRMATNSLEAAGIWGDNVIANQTLQHTQAALSGFDSAIVLLIVGVGLGGIVSAFFVPSHPILFFVFIFLNIISWVVLSPISNATSEIMATEGLAVTANTMPLSILVLQYLPVFAIVFGFIIAIVIAIPRGNY